MTMTFLKQSFLIAASFGFVFAWQQSPLAIYTIPVLGFFIFLYLLIAARKKSLVTIDRSADGLLSIFILNIVILLLVFSTGVFASPLYFLLYFLVFGISFVLLPVTVFVFAIGVILVFLPDALKDDVMTNLIRIGSVGLIAPIAYFLGREFKGKETIEKIDKKK